MADMVMDLRIDKRRVASAWIDPEAPHDCDRLKNPCRNGRPTHSDPSH
jgi:hypothetical protein